MRLHNRQIKAAFWTDTELIKELPPEGRLFYLGLIQLADDSGCLEDDIMAFKILLFPGDKEITEERLSEYRKKLVRLGKLIPYLSEDKPCLFLKNFHKHQTLKNPSPPDVPLPEWVKWEPYSSNNRTGKYIVSRPSVECKKDVRKTSETPVLQSSSNLEPEPEIEPNISTPPPPSPTPDGVAEGAGEGNKETDAKSKELTIEEVFDRYPRYSAMQWTTIREYWEMIRFTRRTGKVAANIVAREMDYWERFDSEVVIEALKIHLARYQTKQEDYTRGIMRRLAREKEMNANGIDRQLGTYENVDRESENKWAEYESIWQN